MDDATSNSDTSTEELLTPNSDQVVFTLGKELTAEALVDLQCPKDVRISPCGRHVIYCLHPATKRDHPKSALWIADVGKVDSARPLTSGFSNDELPRWSCHGEMIAFISDRAKHGQASAIYLVSLAKEDQPIPITDPDNEQKISLISWSPDGRFIAFLSPDETTVEEQSKKTDKNDAFIYHGQWNYNRLRIVHAHTHQVIPLVKEDRHVTECAWSLSSDQLVYVSQKTTDINSPWYDGVKIWRVALGDHLSVDLGIFPGSVSCLTWCRSHIYFLAGAAPSKQCTAGTIYRDTEEGRKWKPYAFGDEDCATDLRWRTDYPAAQVQQGLMDQICLLSGSSPDVHYRGNHEITTWDILDLGKSSSLLVIGKGSASRPTEIYSVQGQELVQLSRHGQAIADLQIADEESFYATANDGTVIDGVLLKPTQNGVNSWPTVVAVHGGPPERVTFAFDVPIFHWGPWLTSKGYAVLCPNYRGSTSHGEKLVSHSRGGVGTKDYDDIIVMILAGIQRGIIDPNRVAIGGYSQGGFLSYLSITRPDFHFRAAVCGGGITDWDMLTMSSDFPSLQSELADGAPWTSNPNSTCIRHASAIWHMENITTPILMLHSEADERIPLSQATAFHRGCMNRKIKCELIVYPREPHVVAERWHRIDMLRRIKDFYDLHMS